MPYSRILARDIMNDDPPYCNLDAPIAEICERFAKENLTGLLVVDEDKRLFGVITETDLIEQEGNLHVPTVVALFDMVIPMGESRFEEELSHMQAMKAEDMIQEKVTTVNVDSNLNEISSIMVDQHVHHLPVLDGDFVVGLICKHDVIKALVEFRESPSA
jgi:CBS domain-containing protein